MFGKLILVLWVMLAAAASHASAAAQRGGWLCKASEDLDISLRVDVHHVETQGGESRYVMRVLADGEKILHSEDADFGQLQDRMVYRGESDLAKAELMIASMQDQKLLKVPALLHLSRIESTLDNHFPLASMIDLLCSRTRTQ